MRSKITVREDFDTSREAFSHAVDVAAASLNLDGYSFCEAFLDIIKEKADGYDSKEGFFNDLQTSGCAGGMVGKLVMSEDCKKFYVEHLDHLEGFKASLDEELGVEITNEKELPRYVFMCWLCFEEFCLMLYRELYEEELVKVSADTAVEDIEQGQEQA